jgi:hypothetical protein
MQGKATKHREPNTKKYVDNCELLSHYLVIMDNKKTPKNPQIFICENCDFKSSNKKDYKRHLGTAKHKRIKMDKNGIKETYDCICGNKYEYQSGLCKHKKKCNYKTPVQIKEEQFIQYIEEQNIKLEEMNEEQKKHNEELKEQISGMSLVTNNNTINNNNVFNLKVFLNNDCKDAMGMTEFLHSIEVSEEDLITFENEGYVKGISSIINRHLSELAITERPIHCTDKKRQTIYFKSEKEGWKKDDENIQVNRLINSVENKSYNKFIDIHEEKGNPEDAYNPESPRHKWYKRLAIETSGGEVGNKEINEKRLLRLTTDLLYIKIKKEVARY